MAKVKEDYLVTSEEYRKRLSGMKRNVYLHGKLTDRTNAEFEGGKALIGMTFDMAFEPEWEEMLTATSSISGKKINRYCHLHQSPEGLLNKVKVTRKFMYRAGVCIQRCMGIDALNGLSVTTFQADKKYGTEYYQRFRNYMENFEKNCLVANCAQTDVKGNRALRPHQQVDPDMYLRIVERKSDGIVVRGAKAHNSVAPYVDEIIALPTRFMTPEDKDYAVAFALPADWEGVKLVCDAAGGSGLVHRRMSRPIDLVGGADSITIFDNVFVPWERVFLCGEHDFAHLLAMGFVRCHRHSYCGCKPGLADIMLGAAALIAEYNGVSHVRHIRDKLIEFITTAELIYAAGIASSVNGERFENGTYLPDEVYANAGRFHAGVTVAHMFEMLADIAGGLAETIKDEDNYLAEELYPLLSKYYVGDARFSADDRFRLFHFIKWAVGGGGLGLVGDIHGGGSPEMERVAIWRTNTENVDHLKEVVKRLAGIKGDKPLPPHLIPTGVSKL